MTLPSESLGVVAYAADDLRIEPAPGRELAGDSIQRAPMVLGHEMVGTVVHAAGMGSRPIVGTPVAVHPAGDGATRYPADRSYATLPSRMLRRLPAGPRLRD